MIQDYSKNIELINAAYNSTGSGQRQFEKTLDSLESKITKLKNAWNEFTMGLANNEIIGLAVDTLRTALDIINDIIESLSGGNGLIKSILTLITVIGGIKLGGTLITKALQSSFAQGIFTAIQGKSADNTQQQAAWYQKGLDAAKSYWEGFKKAPKSIKQAALDIKAGNGKNVVKNVRDFFYVPAVPDYSQVADTVDTGKFVPLNVDDELYRQSNIDALIAKYKEGKIAVNDFKQGLSDWEVANADEIAAQIDAANAAAQNGQVQWKNMSKAAYGAGTALTAVGLAISKIIPGGEELGGIIQTFGTVLLAIGPILSLFEKQLDGLFKKIAAFKAANPEIFALIVAVTVLLGVAIAVIKAIKDNSIEAQLERAAEATEKAREAAESAVQAYEDLVDKKNDLDEMYSKISSLTEGTLEWKKAIVEANNSVMELKKTYKNLELSYDAKTGLLNVDNWDEILKTQYNQVKATSSSYAMSQVKENNLQAELDKENVEKDKDLTSEEKQAKIDAIELNNFATNKTIISSIIEGDLASEIGSYLQTEYEVVDLSSGHYENNSSDDTPTWGRNWVYDTKTITGLEKVQEKARGVVDGYEDIAAAYEEAFGEVPEDMEESEMKNTLIDYETGKIAQEMTDQIAFLSEEEQQAFSLLGGNFSGTFNSLKEGFGLEDTTELANILGITPEELDSQLSAAQEAISPTITKIENSFIRAFDGTAILESLGQKFSFDILKGFSSQMNDMGVEAANNYLVSFLSLFEEADQKDMGEAFANYLSTVDFNDMTEVADLYEYMTELDLDPTEVEAFWRQINKSCKPYLANLEQIQMMTEKISKLGDAWELANEGETTFSSEEKETLIAAGFENEDFIQTGFDEWTFVAEEGNSLLEQINDKVEILTQQKVEGIENAIDLGEEAESIYSQLSEDQQKQLDTLYENGFAGTSLTQEDYNKLAAAFGIDTTYLDTTGIAEQLIAKMELKNNLKDNREQFEQEQVNAASLNYELNGDFGIYTDSLSDDQQKDIVYTHLTKNSGALEYYHELLKKAGKSQNEFDLELANAAIQMTKTTARYKTAAESIDGYKDALLQGESAGADYFAAIDSAKSDLSTLFQIDESLIDNAFIEKNKQLIADLAVGGETGTAAFQNLWAMLKEIEKTDAIEQLETELKEMYGQVDDVTGEIYQDVVNVADLVNELEPTLEVKFLGEDSALKGALLALIQNSKLTGKAAIEALSPVLSLIETITGTKIDAHYEYETKIAKNEQDAQILMDRGYERVGKTNKYIRKSSLQVSYTSNTDSILSNFVAPDLSSGGSGSDKTSTWLNPYDKLYNLTEQINEQLRQREKLEREYDRILERRGSTFGELRKNYNDQISSLEKEIQLQERLRAGRLDQLANVASERYKGQDANGNELIQSYAAWGVTKYANYDTNTGVITIDWDAIDKVTDEEKGAAIEDYISRLEELQEQIEAIDEQVEDFQDRILELQKEGMQDYLDFEQRVYDAIVELQQSIIDDFQDLSDKIADSNSEILDSLQDSIDLQRQIRDNTETEEDLAEKEARLAYLRRDTSNANLLEIQQLEDELADSRQDYEDSLVDQQLERLTKQNDDAQAAREKQIELMQAQLDYAAQNGEFWGQAYELIQSGFSADGDLNQASQLWELLKNDEGWKGMSKFGQLNWQEEISKAILAASNGYANWNMYQAEQVDKSLTLPDGTQLTYDGKNWKDANGTIYNDVDYDSTKGEFTYGSKTGGKSNSEDSGKDDKKNSGSGSSGSSVGIGSRVKVDPSTPIYATSYGEGGGKQYYANDPIYNVLDERNGYYLTRHHKLGAGWTGWFKKGDVKAYKTGGIADFTGPAWLDGTKSKPELILNARDTENFIALKDILESAMRQRAGDVSEPTGDMYFNIDINVDELANDYDVEQLGAKIKRELTDAAMYRNVNLVNFIR